LQVKANLFVFKHCLLPHSLSSLIAISVYLNAMTATPKLKARVPAAVWPGLLSLGIGIAGFLLVAMAVDRGWIRHIDEQILQSVRNLTIRNDDTGRLWAEESVIAITSLGAQVVLIGICCIAVGLLVLVRRIRLCIFLLAVLLGAIGLNQCLKPVFGRPRPTVVPHVQRVNTKSFPSGHALVATAVYAALAAVTADLLRERKLKKYVFFVSGLLMVLIGLSRVYLGVHYPSDVVAGWIAGLLWAGVCRLSAQSWKRGIS
jgi:undecaprenyl-diphosphatase